MSGTAGATWTDSRLRTPSMRQMIWAVVLVAVVTWPLYSGPFYLFLAISAVITAIVVLSVGVVSGDAGMPSLCQVAFAAISAWTFTQLAAAENPLPVALQVVISVLVAGVLGAVVSLPALRVRSVNLAVVTLGVAGAVGVFLSSQGFAGVFVDRPGFALSDEAFYLLSLACFAVLAVVLGVVRNRPLGIAWRSVRNSERATAALGVSVVRTKITAFVISALVAGIAGVLTVLQLGVVSLSNFPTLANLVVFAVAIFIGGWRWQGALLAGIMTLAIPEILNRLGISQDWGNVLFAVGAIQVLAGGHAVAEALWPGRSRGMVDRLEPETAWQNLVSSHAGRTLGRAAAEPVLVVRDLSVRYGGVTAVDSVDLEVRSGEIIGLIGANGAGKTSLIDAVSGYTAAGGEVTVAGAVLAGSPQARVRAGLRRTFQQDRVVTTVTVAQYLRLAAGKPLDSEHMEALVAFCGASSQRALVGDLEGASRRLLEVAAAFSARPAVILLDEPVAGLSRAEALLFADKLRHSPAVFDCAVLIVEHDVDFVRAVCTRAVAVDFGRVIAEGTPDEVLANPRVRVAYLGEQEMTA